jgi:serine/threonine-protein kinase
MDDREFELLDEYLRRLHGGSGDGRDDLLAAHPELESAVRCLEALEQMAPRPGSSLLDVQLTSGAAATAGSDDPTLSGAAEAAHRAPDKPISTREFGDYDLLEEIGRGGMGVVYRARQRSLDRIVAVKMILANLWASEDQVRRFQTEARAAASLSHPHIVNIFEVGQVQGQHYFAMQHVAGCSLADRLAEGPMLLEHAVRLLIDVARAVEHLHQHDIVHRDIKPSNILLDNEDCPYVTDFGLAKVCAGDSQRTATGVVAGTPSYMAPEQAWPGQEPVGPQSDVYSLGAILYEVLTGRPPFRADNPIDTLIQVREREPVLPRQLNRRVPRELELICLKCLEKSPQRRYQSAAALADELERFLKDEALLVRPPNPAQRAVRWARRQPALATHLAALAAYWGLEWFDYRVLKLYDSDFHRVVTMVVLAWAACSVLFQQLLQSPRWATLAIFAWAFVDAASLLAIVYAGSGVVSPILVGYPLLIAASGLWFRVRLVIFMTALSVLAYVLLLADLHYHPGRYAPTDAIDPGRHLFFLLALIILGAITAYQVSRIRALSRYYERRVK